MNSPPHRPAHFRQATGVSSSGVAGEHGNEGFIRIAHEGAIEVPLDDEGVMVEGIYLAHLSLSKVSIEFEFVPRDGEPFSASKLAEVTVPRSASSSPSDHAPYPSPRSALRSTAAMVSRRGVRPPRRRRVVGSSDGHRRARAWRRRSGCVPRCAQCFEIRANCITTANI